MTQPQKMGPSEALVETLVAHEVTHVFGIVGSAFMDALDLFPAAGIQFVPVAHEQGAIHMADGYARASGRHGVCIAQNGPGVTNFVTGVAAAYWAHSPVVFITPEAGSMTTGLGGFQETEQLPIFSKITRYQGHVNNPKRMAEIAGRCFDRAMLEMGPTQLNIPRDFFYGEIETSIPRPMRFSHGPGDSAALDAAAELLAGASFPVILAGGGVIMAGARTEAIELAELLGAAVCSSYLHNDSFPASHAPRRHPAPPAARPEPAPAPAPARRASRASPPKRAPGRASSPPGPMSATRTRSKWRPAPSEYGSRSWVQAASSFSQALFS